MMVIERPIEFSIGRWLNLQWIDPRVIAWRVQPGEPIVWTNADAIPHTVTSDDGVWDSGDVAPGQTYRLVLDKPGTYKYHCMHHPYMIGTIVVTA